MEIYFLGLEIIFFCYWIEFWKLVFSLYFRNIRPAVRLSRENMVIFYTYYYIYSLICCPNFGIPVTSHGSGRFGMPPSMLPKQFSNFYKKLYHFLVKKSKVGIRCYIFNKLYFRELLKNYQCLPILKC